MAKVSISAAPFQHGDSVLFRIVPMVFGALVTELDVAQNPACDLLMMKLHLSVRKRDSAELHEALRIATDVHGLSSEGRQFALRVGAELASHTLSWQEWEALLQNGFPALPRDYVGTIGRLFSTDKMHGFVRLTDGRVAFVHSSAFRDPQTVLSEGDRVAGRVVLGQNALLLQNVYKV